MAGKGDLPMVTHVRFNSLQQKHNSECRQVQLERSCHLGAVSRPGWRLGKRVVLPFVDRSGFERSVLEDECEPVSLGPAAGAFRP